MAYIYNGTEDQPREVITRCAWCSRKTDQLYQDNESCDMVCGYCRLDGLKDEIVAATDRLNKLQADHRMITGVRCRA